MFLLKRCGNLIIKLLALLGWRANNDLQKHRFLKEWTNAKIHENNEVITKKTINNLFINKILNQRIILSNYEYPNASPFRVVFTYTLTNIA